MPEGPEIRRAADEIEAAIGGRITTAVEFHLPALKRWERRLTGIRVLRVETRGKAMLTRFGNGLILYSHNQLYGRWYCVPCDRPPRTKRQLRLAIHTRERSALLYSASEIQVLHDEELDAHPFLSRLGPDVLAPETDDARLVARLHDSRFVRRRLGQLLTDQGFVAGLGNYLRCEILFHCALHPNLRPVDLDRRQIGLLASAIIQLPRQSYATGGITNEPRRAEQSMSAGATFEQARFLVYRREGLPCYRCGAAIKKISAGGQGCYLCSTCQKPL